MNDKLFMMSMLYDKQIPKDFGLVSSIEPDTFLLPEDNSLWKQRDLYDFGWGKEKGYYRLPLPDFDTLVKIVLTSEWKDNKYGAAAIILEDYLDELLSLCQDILKDNINAKRYIDFFKILQLENPVNRRNIVGRSVIEIAEDYNKWKEVSEKIILLLNHNRK